MSAPTLIQANPVTQLRDLIPLFQRYQVLPQIWRGVVIDEAIAPFSCTEAECQDAIAQLQSTANPVTQASTSPDLLAELARRSVRLEKFKLATWGNTLESYFLKRKQDYDCVTYSLLRTKDQALATELYFRIAEGEQSFAEIARDYSQGVEAQSGGLIGPVPLSKPHPVLRKLLSISQAGQLWQPQWVENWLIIVRLEQMRPAVFDEAMRQRLLNERFEIWLAEQIQHYSQPI